MKVNGYVLEEVINKTIKKYIYEGMSRGTALEEFDEKIGSILPYLEDYIRNLNYDRERVPKIISDVSDILNKWGIKIIGNGEYRDMGDAADFEFEVDLSGMRSEDIWKYALTSYSSEDERPTNPDEFVYLFNETIMDDELHGSNMFRGVSVMYNRGRYSIYIQLCNDWSNLIPEND